MSPKATRRLRLLGFWAFWFWAPMPIVLIGLLLSTHLLTLPEPEPVPSRIHVEGTGLKALEEKYGLNGAPLLDP